VLSLKFVHVLKNNQSLLMSTQVVNGDRRNQSKSFETLPISQYCFLLAKDVNIEIYHLDVQTENIIRMQPICHT